MAAISRYRRAVLRRIRFPYTTIPTSVIVTPRLINPHAMNIFVSPFVSIHGVIANGMPMLNAFRRKAMPVNASPVIYPVSIFRPSIENAELTST